MGDSPICNQCGSERGNRRKCQECNRRYQRKWLENNRKKQQERVKENTKRYKAVAEAWIWEYLETHPCVDCGLLDPIVMHFDHRDRETKTKGVSRLVCNGASLSRVQAEVAKCDVRCANCHMRRTAKQLGWSRYFRDEGR